MASSTSTSGSNLPRPSKSRLPVSISSIGSHLVTPRDHPTAAAKLSSRLTTSLSTPRLPKSPVARPQTLTTNARPSQSHTAQVPPHERPRMKSVPKQPRERNPEQATPSKVPVMSIKEAIALKRAETKKVMAVQRAPSDLGGSNSCVSVENTSSSMVNGLGDDLGRLSIRETIERARSSGSLNLASRNLMCLPSALFEIHLSITPEKLASVSDEPPLPDKPGHKSNSNPTTWYDQQDLTFLRARNNQIVELQPEISLFGSLKTVDFRMNCLASLPDSFADLTSLVNLDLSHNALTALPPHIFSLPALSLLDISYNALTALPFNMPFYPATSPPSRSRRSSDYFSAPEIVRATCPLPSLASLDASYNQIVSSAIHRDALPRNLRSFDLACNPLGNVAELLISLSALTQLVDLRMPRCDIDDTSFPASLLSSANKPTFPKLTILDLEETRATQAAVSRAFCDLTQAIDFEASVTDARTVSTGILAVAVGKRIMREAWEIEADHHVQRLREKRSAVNLGGTPISELPQPLPQPADVGQGLLPGDTRSHSRVEAPQHVSQDPETGAKSVSPHITPVLRPYWDPRTLTLTLPRSPGRLIRAAGTAMDDEMLPRATLPLALIATQPFAETLRTLELRGRRAEPAFVLPTSNGQPLLPRLETLNLEGCALSDAIPGASMADGGVLGVLAQLFPGLRNLELGYNGLTGALVARGVLEQLFFAGKGGRAGLRRLGLCGNKIEELHGLRDLAWVVFGADVAKEGVELGTKWTLEELDVRENSITGLPGELGLLPLDSFLVDGNIFRVPPRRVWEREGTNGLLTWLRGRLEAQ